MEDDRIEDEDVKVVKDEKKPDINKSNLASKKEPAPNSVSEYEITKCSQYNTKKKELALYLALLYNETIEGIFNNYVTIVVTD